MSAALTRIRGLVAERDALLSIIEDVRSYAESCTFSGRSVNASDRELIEDEIGREVLALLPAVDP